MGALIVVGVMAHIAISGYFKYRGSNQYDPEYRYYAARLSATGARRYCS